MLLSVLSQIRGADGQNLGVDGQIRGGSIQNRGADRQIRGAGRRKSGRGTKDIDRCGDGFALEVVHRITLTGGLKQAGLGHVLENLRKNECPNGCAREDYTASTASSQ